MNLKNIKDEFNDFFLDILDLSNTLEESGFQSDVESFFKDLKNLKPKDILSLNNIKNFFERIVNFIIFTKDLARRNEVLKNNIQKNQKLVLLLDQIDLETERISKQDLQDKLMNSGILKKGEE